VRSISPGSRCAILINKNGGRMKILIIGDRARYEKFRPADGIYDRCEKVFCRRGTADSELLSEGADADVIFADAVSPVSAHLISQMPNLKMIHSEGVAFDRIDLESAKERRICVCHNRGGNAGAVAEQTILLMHEGRRDPHQYGARRPCRQRCPVRSHRFRQACRRRAGYCFAGTCFRRQSGREACGRISGPHSVFTPYRRRHGRQFPPYAPPHVGKRGAP
jgi:hypothetical protein